MHTYFILRSDKRGSSQVKIGRSKDITQRLRSLEVGLGQTLQLVLVLKGDHELELHRKFSEHRIAGEWFFFATDIKQFIVENLGSIWKPPFLSWLQQAYCSEPRVTELVRRQPNQVSRLHVLLRGYERDPEMRRFICQAHREWRELPGCCSVEGALIGAAKRTFDSSPRLVRSAGAAR